MAAPGARAADGDGRHPRRIYSNRVLERAASILGAFGPQRTELRLGDFAGLGLHKSTVFRLLEALRAHRLVELDVETGRYRLGLRLFELGMLAVSRLELSRSAQRPLEALVERTGETAHLGVLDGDEVIAVARSESQQALRMPGGLGRRSPAHCSATGKVLLAQLPEAELRGYLSRPLRAMTQRSLTRPDALLRELRAVRQRGYAIDDEEVFPGVRCVGAPIRDHTGAVVAAVSAAGPTTRLAREHFPRLAVDVVRAADEISRKLGYREAATAP